MAVEVGVTLGVCMIAPDGVWPGWLVVVRIGLGASQSLVGDLESAVSRGPECRADTRGRSIRLPAPSWFKAFDWRAHAGTGRSSERPVLSRGNDDLRQAADEDSLRSGHDARRHDDAGC